MNNTQLDKQLNVGCFFQHPWKTRYFKATKYIQTWNHRPSQQPTNPWGRKEPKPGPSPGRGASQRSIQSDATSGGGHPGGLVGLLLGGWCGLGGLVVGIEEDI